jgi:hypothetical protein
MVNSNLNADLLDGYNVEGLFETLGSTKDVNLTVQIGGTNKTINDLYATYDSEGDNIVGKYVTLSTNQTIDGIKTFSKLAHFTITDSSPFTVASSVLVEKLNAEQLGRKKLNELFTNFANVSDKKVNITIGGVSKDLYIDYSKTAH